MTPSRTSILSSAPSRPGSTSAPRTPGREGVPTSAEEGYLHCGPSGAGHFVKMVHNGIEYGIMAAYAEGLNILHHAGVGLADRAVNAETSPLRDPRAYQYRMDLAEITELWRRGSVVASWLLDLTAQAMVPDPELADFGGVVADSGEGRWTSIAAIDDRRRRPPSSRPRSTRGSRRAARRTSPTRSCRRCASASAATSSSRRARADADGAPSCTIPADGAIDLLSLGGLVIRLDTGLVPFRKAHEAAIHVSGAEYNVAANLSDCFGLRTAVATAMVDYPVGDLVARARPRRRASRPFYSDFTHDGVTGPQHRHGLLRPRRRRPGPGRVLQPRQRGGRAAAARRLRLGRDLRPGRPLVPLGRPVRGPVRRRRPSCCSRPCRRPAATAPSSRSTSTSGPSCGSARGGVEQAQAVTRRLVEEVDVLVGNEEDMQLSPRHRGPRGGPGRRRSTRRPSSA